ncbi:hypothetical protein C1645_759855, partial [Glomus cerebriforme]
MNQNYSKDQLFASQTNSEQVETNSSMNIPYMAVQQLQHASINSSNQRYGNPEVYPQTSLNPVVNLPIVQDNFVVNLPTTFAFFYQPPNDPCNYHIKCNEISIHSLNEFNSNLANINFYQNKYIFFYQRQSNNRIYQVICEIVSPSLIINLLNKSIYGIEIEQNTGQEQLTFTFEQKENLKSYLIQYL